MKTNLDRNMKFRIFANEVLIMDGQKLNMLRKKHNLTQKQIAEAINCDQARISQWENEKYKISKAYQTLLEQFFSKFPD